MKKIRILTRDERLLRELSLLLPKDFTLSEDADFVILDADTATLKDAKRRRVLIITRTPKESERNVLARPFSFSALEEALHRVFDDGDAVFLSSTEEKLLSLLKNAKGMPVSRARLMNEIWGNGDSDNLLNLYIHYLREKLEKDGKRRIFAVRGKGYFYKC